MARDSLNFAEPLAGLPFRTQGSAVAMLHLERSALRAPPDSSDAGDGARSKVWQLASSLHCSIIGTCLATGELRALLGKFKAFTVDNPSDHDLHGIAVAAVGTRSPLAKQIQKALDRRHAAAIRRFMKARSAEEVQALWEDAKRIGDIPGGYWAIVTHPLATDAIVRRAFGDVHMLSHLVGAANRADIRRLHQLERDKAALEEKLARQQAHLRDGISARDAKIRDLEALLAARLEPDPTPVASETATLRDLAASLSKQIAAATQRSERAEQRASEAMAARAAAEQRRNAAERELALLRQELDAAEAALAEPAAEEGTCGAPLDLAGMTLLYVGGRPSLVGHLKALVEAASGRFIHHDGGVEESRDLLPGLVSRANVALFPVDCISHSAAQSLKRLCQQGGKRFIPLRSSGVASLLQGLRTLAP